jgi:hypothetical protein
MFSGNRLLDIKIYLEFEKKEKEFKNITWADPGIDFKRHGLKIL